jgi:hypothetical protein
MTDNIADFRHLDSLDLQGLHIRYAELIEGLQKLPNGLPDPNAVHDDLKLREMCVILANLRKRSAGPPKKRAPAGSKKQVIETSINDL